MNKKGNWLDIFGWAIISLVLAMALGGLYLLNHEVNENLLNTAIVANNTDANTMLTEHQNRLPFIFDFIIPAIYLGLLVFSAVSARRVLSSHMLAPITLFVAPLMVSLAIVVEIVWEKYTAGTNLLATLIVSDLNITDGFMSRFIIFTCIYIFIVGVSLYTKDE